MTVSACFITRNHERSLGAAVRSVAGLAADVLVVDTGSTDGTVPLAASLGARVAEFAWADDFAAACNFALDQAAGEWVLWLNPDEAVDPAGVPAVAAAAAQSTVFAHRLRVQHELREHQPGHGVAEPQFRLFRRDPGIRFRGRLHPDFVTPLDRLAAARGQSVRDLDAVVHRYAYLSPSTPDKMRWVVRLLEAELRDRPGQLHTLIELGRNLLWLNDPRGHEVLATAAEQVRPFIPAARPPHPDVGLLLEYLLAVSPEQSRSRVGRDEVRELALRWFPATPPVLWAVAGERFTANDFATAAQVLHQLVQMGQSGRYDPAGGFDPDIVGRSARMNLGACYVRLGLWAAARDWLRPLRADPTYGPRATELSDVAEQQLRRPSASDPGTTTPAGPP